ncbi:flippase [Robbsia sp. KACC 23696]|uniref:flippase n=1 Tax=Robbsia sp. KACC 23696 TaxID=3149231 RepID=UPI00325A5FC4
MAGNLRRNSLYNLMGSVLPIAVSLITVPMYLHHVGSARYGLLTIVWMLQGYFGFFDFGLSRATANQVAKLGDATDEQRESVFWTALMLNTLFGLVGAVVLYILGETLMVRFFKMDAELKNEVMMVMPWIAASVPVTTISGALTGCLEGRERFGVLNSVQVFNTFLFQTLPLAASFAFGVKLNYMIPATIIAGSTAIVLLFITNIFQFPLRLRGRPSLKLGRELFGYGAWVTVTNLASPLLESSDRFLIGSLLGTKAVAYYNVPYTLAIRLRIIPGVVARTIFPRMSALQQTDSARFFVQTAQALSAFMTPCVVFGLFVLEPFMSVWVNPDFAMASAPIGRIIMLGVWINSLAFIPSTYLQAVGRPNVIAIFHVVELLPFLGILYAFTHYFGLPGAATAWSLRVLIDGVLLFWAAKTSWEMVRKILPAIALLLVSYIVAEFTVHSLLLTAITGIVLTALSLIWAWRVEERLRTVTSKIAGRLGWRARRAG